MIEIKDLSKFYKDGSQATLGLRNINLKLAKGEIVAITGESGSGKSTLLNVITALDSYDEGEILFNGKETSYFDSEDRDNFRRSNVAFIYQKYNILDSYTALENVMVPLIAKGMSYKASEARAKELLLRVGLSNKLKQRGLKLSGGEKQRCAIARALATDSRILACDEPTGSLDSKTGKEIISLIKELSKDKLVLIVTHNYEEVRPIATRRIELRDSEIISDTILGEVEDDEIEASSNTENKKVSLLASLWFSIKGIIRKPKATIFRGLILTVAMLSLLVLACFGSSFSGVGKRNEYYNIQDSDRLIIYSKKHTPIDKNKLKGLNLELYENAFYEDQASEFIIENSNSKTSIDLYLTEHKISYRLAEGELPKEKNEYILVLPDNTDALPGIRYKYDSFIGSKLSINTFVKDNFGYISRIEMGKISGIGYSKSLRRPTIVMNQELSDSFRNILLLNKISFKYDNVTEMLSFFSYNRPGKTKLILPLGFKKEGIMLRLGMYSVELPVEVVNENVTRPQLIVGEDWLRGELKPNLECYELSCYTNDLKSLRKEANRLGYDTIAPNELRLDNVDTIIYNAYIVVITIVAILVFALAYILIKLSYKNKIKDYAILRANNAKSSDLKLSTCIELIIIGLGAIIVSLATVGILSSQGIAFFTAYSLKIGLVFTALMLIFLVLTALAIKNKLVNKKLIIALREGDLND